MPLLRNAFVLVVFGSTVFCLGQGRTTDDFRGLPPDTRAPAHRAQRVRTAEPKPQKPTGRAVPANPQAPAAQQASQTALPPGQTPSVAPRFQLNGDKLTVIAPNSSMAEIIAGLRQTLHIPIEVEGGATGERVAAQIGPAPVRSVLLSLFDGSRYDYFILGSASDPQMVSKVILTPKTGGGAVQTAGPAPVQAAPQPSEEMEQTVEPEQPEQEEENPGFAQPENTPEQQTPEQQTPEQQNANPNNVKTPEQLLEELKQMEKQKQQQPDNQNKPQRPDRPQ